MTDQSGQAQPTTPLRIIYAGTPEFAVSGLNALLDTNHQIIAVYTQPDRPSGRGRKIKPGPVKQLALDHDIPVFQPLSLRDAEAQEQLAALDADLMVVAAYGLILPEVVLNTPRLGCINIHASLLPRWRGAAPIQFSILSGDAETGVTIMQMAKGLDTGDMLLKGRCTIEPQECAADLHDKLAELSGPLLLQTITDLAQARANPIPQDDELSTYAPKILKLDAAIDWQQSALQISQQVRAYNNWPVAYSQVADERVRIWSANPNNDSDANSAALPGTILACELDGITVACGEGVLSLQQIQFAGGKALSIRDLLNSGKVRLKAGDQFQSIEASSPAQPAATKP